MATHKDIYNYVRGSATLVFVTWCRTLKRAFILVPAKWIEINSMLQTNSFPTEIVCEVSRISIQMLGWKRHKNRLVDFLARFFHFSIK